MTLDEYKALITLATLRRQLDSQIIDTLTAGDEGLLTTAIHAAARWVFAGVVRCGVQGKKFTDDEIDIIKGALEKRAIYELYTRSEVEASAEDKAEDATGLLRAVLGDCVDAQATPKAYVGAAVSAPSNPRPAWSNT